MCQGEAQAGVLLEPCPGVTRYRRVLPVPTELLNFNICTDTTAKSKIPSLGGTTFSSTGDEEMEELEGAKHWDERTTIMKEGDTAPHSLNAPQDHTWLNLTVRLKRTSYWQ
jgi:hypothetical protein|mmetsp:Transcript_86803/g.144365  ORF Transcript_86803/g.144365 Transcript_86803/m.144365 type:complete len:111 (-) Transcript_86803:1761-2093(-)